MGKHHAPIGEAVPRAAAPALDQATVRALCDAGFISSRDYVDMAAVQGWQPDPVIRARLARLAPPIPQRDSAPGGFDDPLPGDA
ncbi:hypothetical protein [Methylobacterium haplocladii]|uniref:Uncharacterized protein n=1 Tax=Methylobacterium haplocladii TaxID=1176176 RepID=A0A512IS72_9HYPH|nr:hypothetical protein [Methylobacterium haplocladii]GEP00526.1 hypothetical protein MHA02_29130 [Methylobacterium haplocladii]GJD85441.1 hypothetical protein HPGCJGGD_3330 [Methylobacterium haplocladii]GLS57826.1 hypothetical protein GCM10007887_04820 [Methylobacterium haplocladii]